jgi:dCMP deaminase
MTEKAVLVDKEFLDEEEGRDTNGSKRKDYLSWDEYFMGIALLSSQRSKDPSTQVGACIVDSENKIVGIGYNGFPMNCSDEELPWARHAKNVNDTKYPYVVHAEVNAVLNSTKKLTGARIYVALFPCNECAKVIIQSGIKEVVYLSDKYSETDSVIASKRMFDMAGVTCKKVKASIERITIDFGV